MAELMCPGCKTTIDPGTPYCPVCFSIPVVRPEPEEPAPASRATAPTPACVDPDCPHGGTRPTTACRACGLGVTAVPVLRFSWGALPVSGDQAVAIGRENSPLAAHLTGHTNVSRQHAEIRAESGTLVVVDLGSTNGTFVNDQRIAARTPTPLKPGDKLRFAAHVTAEVTAA